MADYLQERSTVPLFAHIAAGVFIGSIASAFVCWLFIQWRANVAIEEAQAQMKRLVLEQQAQQMQQQARDRQQAEAQLRTQAAQRSALAAAQAATERDKRQQLEAQSRREEAWARFYTKRPQCDESKGGAWTVECANEFIRAKRRFEDLYSSGRL